jgi:hypothetical protein
MMSSEHISNQKEFHFQNTPGQDLRQLSDSEPILESSMSAGPNPTSTPTSIPRALSGSPNNKAKKVWNKMKVFFASLNASKNKTNRKQLQDPSEKEAKPEPESENGIHLGLDSLSLQSTDNDSDKTVLSQSQSQHSVSALSLLSLSLFLSFSVS